MSVNGSRRAERRSAQATYGRRHSPPVASGAAAACGRQRRVGFSRATEPGPGAARARGRRAGAGARRPPPRCTGTRARPASAPAATRPYSYSNLCNYYHLLFNVTYLMQCIRGGFIFKRHFGPSAYKLRFKPELDVHFRGF